MPPDAVRKSAALAVAAVVHVATGAALGQPFPYQAEVDRWNAQDAADPVADGGVVFVGSSSIRRWEQLQLDFNDYRIVQRGFGGSQFEDLNNFVDELVLSYAPSAVVLWIGTNDLSSGEPASEVFADYQTFLSLVRAERPNLDILYLGVTPTPANQGTETARDAFNALIQAEAAADPKVHYIDLPSAFYALNPYGAPEFTSLYVDPVHLNRQGYDLWTTIVRPAVESVVTPNRVFTPNPDTLAIGERLLFDFGPSNPDDGNQTANPDANGNVWNNWYPAEGGAAINAGEHIGDLVDTAGTNTGIGLTVTGGFASNGLLNGGLATPDAALLADLAIATATQDYFFSGADNRAGGGNDDIPGGFVLDGLDPNNVYELQFFGSRNTNEIRQTEYRITGANEVVVTLRTSGTNIGSDGSYDGNDDEIAVARGARPDQFGRLFVDMTVLRGSFAYINAMQLEAVPSAFLAQPADSIAEPGGTLTFSADAELSGADASLQWERDGVPLTDDPRISGSTTATLTIAFAAAADNGTYRLVASGGGTTAVSDPAIGAVRPSHDPSDVNGDGEVDPLDVLDLLEILSPGQ